MDPQGAVGTQLEWANLRSRGDGPIPPLVELDVVRKPPLTRRWTSTDSETGRSTEQTSAHAEMDRPRRTQEPETDTNLRSRGDGPAASKGFATNQCKPPLTRRWT